MLSLVVGTLSSGALTQKVGYYTPFAIIGACVMSVGAGLLTTLEVNTSEGKWVGYQILNGLGVGLCIQSPNIAVQTVLPKDDVPIGSSFLVFSLLLGGAIFVSVGQNVLDNQLLRRFSKLPGVNPALVTKNGATALLKELPPHLRARALADYNASLRVVFQIGLILACITVVANASLEWKNIKKKGEKAKEDEKSKDVGRENEEEITNGE